METTAISKKICEEVERKNSHLNIISSEMFEHADPEFLHEVIEREFSQFDVRLIKYVRPHLPHVVSWFSENLKNGSTQLNLDNFVRRNLHKKFSKRAPEIQKWSAVFQENITIRAMKRDMLFQRSVVDDFLKFALGSEDFVVDDLPHANQKMSQAKAEVLSSLLAGAHVLKTQPEWRKFYLMFSENMGNVLRLPDSEIQLTSGEVQTLQETYQGDAEAIDLIIGGNSFADDLMNASKTSYPVERDKLVSAEEKSLIHSFGKASAPFFTAYNRHTIS